MPLKPLKSTLLWLRQQLFESTCLLCQMKHNNGDALICEPCRLDLPSPRHSCQQCALPLAEGAASLCGQCLNSPPPFNRCLAPFMYRSPINQLVTRFKYHRHLLDGRLLGQLLLNEIRQRYHQEHLPDLLIPVPLHWRRQFQRGYNQSQHIANYIGSQLNISVEYRRLSRIRYTVSQQGLNKHQRQHNLRQAFKVKRVFHGETVALIDDVVTTGSTAAEISTLLLKAGAAEVHVWALARTPLPE